MTTYLIVGFLLFSVVSILALAAAIRNAKDDTVDEWGFAHERRTRVLVRRNGFGEH